MRLPAFTPAAKRATGRLAQRARPFKLVRSGMSQRQATEYVYRAFAREQGVDVPAHPGPNASKPPSLDC